MRTEAMRIARAWLGTPYVEGASQCGVATDCVGLIEGVARDLGLKAPSRTALSRDLLAAANLFLEPCEDPIPGSVILFAQSPRGLPVHAGLMGEEGRFFHAHWTAGVVENRYGRWFKSRTTHVFDWPNSGLPTHFHDQKGLS
ncbi:MAG: hypothetical protein CFE32_14695 [Alphaproteobacteria bacterium PA3]|nr:MAG: hypothetical protein CFE32_14695 [Alphaproteobacteria bacterium PA3]